MLFYSFLRRRVEMQSGNSWEYKYQNVKKWNTSITLEQNIAFKTRIKVNKQVQWKKIKEIRIMKNYTSRHVEPRIWAVYAERLRKWISASSAASCSDRATAQPAVRCADPNWPSTWSWTYQMRSAGCDCSNGKDMWIHESSVLNNACDWHNSFARKWV